MAYDRYPRGTNPQGDYYNRSEVQDYGRDYASGRGYSSARDYQAAGYDLNDDGDGNRGGRDQGERGYGQRGSGDRDTGRRDYAQREYGYAQRDYGQRDYGQGSYGGRDYGHERYGQREQFNRGQSYGGDRDRQYGRQSYGGQAYGDRGQRGSGDYDRGGQGRGYGRQPQGYDYEERGFFDRAGDEVRSWFGDEDAERRRDMDQRYDERAGRTGRTQHDDDYHSWRSTQMAALDRDYDEYRRENRSRFESEFSTWRTNRQTQRESLNKVQEHQEVVGSDGQHVGTVDKVKGDRIVLTKTDQDAGGRHHSIPCSWITSVDDKVTLNKSADEAKRAWRDEERNQAMFGDRAETSATGTDRSGGQSGSQTDSQLGGQSGGQHGLNRSFSGTY